MYDTVPWKTSPSWSPVSQSESLSESLMVAAISAASPATPTAARCCVLSESAFSADRPSHRHHRKIAARSATCCGERTFAPADLLILPPVEFAEAIEFAEYVGSILLVTRTTGATSGALASVRRRPKDAMLLPAIAIDGVDLSDAAGGEHRRTLSPPRTSMCARLLFALLHPLHLTPSSRGRSFAASCLATCSPGLLPVPVSRSAGGVAHAVHVPRRREPHPSGRRVGGSTSEAPHGTEEGGLAGNGGGEKH